jgi:hypothetical protein
MRAIVLVVVTVALSFVPLRAQPTPRAAADELIAADRAFSTAAAGTNPVTALSAMFATNVALTHAGGIAYGSVDAVTALKASPINTTGRIEWTPARVGVSGDGRHGFTAGFMTHRRDDGSTTPMKYLAYWEKQAGGWRVLAYKRRVSKVAAPAMDVGYVLPARVQAAAPDAATIERYRDSLAGAERSFSRDAQTMGIGKAFAHYGHPDAINLGGPDRPGFVIGNAQIGVDVAGDTPSNTSPVFWGPEKTIVAESGDFGVTIGFITPHQPGPDGKTPNIPFFTIWIRTSTNDPWRYIAE